jgi:hypothetical protein
MAAKAAVAAAVAAAGKLPVSCPWNPPKPSPCRAGDRDIPTLVLLPAKGVSDTEGEGDAAPPVDASPLAPPWLLVALRARPEP